jgi:hypothetical protein
VSEKMLAGEGWRGAAARAVREELGPALPAGQEPQVRRWWWRCLVLVCGG